MTEPRLVFSDQQPGPTIEDLGPEFVDVARKISAICATRVLLMISVLTGSAIWLFSVYDPSRDRLEAAIAFSIVFVGPQVALYWRRG
jgi:hypothetical protein